MRCLLLSPDFRQFHLVKRFPYRSSFPPLHFIGYQGARNRAREAVNAGSLLNPGSSGDLTELNHGSQTATGRRRLIKVTNLPLKVHSVSSNGSSVEYANMYVCVSVCVHVCMCVGHFAMWSRCRTCRFISGSSCTLRRQFLDWLSVPSSNLVMLNRHLRLPVFYSLQLPHRKALSLLLYVSLEQYVIFWVKRCSARI